LISVFLRTPENARFDKTMKFHAHNTNDFTVNKINQVFILINQTFYSLRMMQQQMQMYQQMFPQMFGGGASGTGGEAGTEGGAGGGTMPAMPMMPMYGMGEDGGLPMAMAMANGMNPNFQSRKYKQFILTVSYHTINISLKWRKYNFLKRTYNSIEKSKQISVLFYCKFMIFNLALM
jgi:hypothetical protein